MHGSDFIFAHVHSCFAAGKFRRIRRKLSLLMDTTFNVALHIHGERFPHPINNLREKPEWYSVRFKQYLVDPILRPNMTLQ